MNTNRIKLALLALLAGVVNTVSADNVTLAWDPNTEQDVTGYILYVGEGSRSYTQALRVGLETQHEVRDLLPGVTYFFAVTAYNGNGLESDFSDEVSYVTAGAVVVAKMLPPEISATGATLHGEVSGVTADYTFWFEVCEGAVFDPALAVKTPVQSKGATITALVPCGNKQYTARLCVDSIAVLYVSAPVQFNHVKPSAPRPLHFVPKIIETSSVSLSVEKSPSIIVPEWREVFYTMLDEPEDLVGPAGYYRAMIAQHTFGQ